jgi:hypothetical protein
MFCIYLRPRHLLRSGEAERTEETLWHTRLTSLFDERCSLQCETLQQSSAVQCIARQGWSAHNWEIRLGWIMQALAALVKMQGGAANVRARMGGQCFVSVLDWQNSHKILRFSGL